MPDNENTLIKKVIEANQQNTTPKTPPDSPNDDDSEDDRKGFKPIPLAIIPQVDN